MMRYCGIGSRKTPPDILKLMEDFAHAVAPYAILHSGGAPGADSAFEFGATLGGGQREIYLPWKGFNGRQEGKLTEPTEAAMEIAEFFHPAWMALSWGGKRLHGRNTHQILGADLMTPVELVVCWTPNASSSGGTGQALRIARDREIEVWDLADPRYEQMARDVVDGDGIALR